MRLVMKSQPNLFRGFKVLFLIVFLFAISFSSVFAATLKIETMDVAPLGFLGADGKPTGVLYEVSNLIAKEAGIPYENILSSYSRMVKDLEDGNASFILRLYGNEDLDKNCIQIAQIAIPLQTIIVGTGGTSFKTLDDLHGKTVGILRGSVLDEKFSADKLINKYEVNDYTQMLKMLTTKRLDAVVGSAMGLYYEAQKLGMKKGELGIPFVLSTGYNKLFFSKKLADENTIAALKAAVDRLNKQGAFTKIFNKYVGDFI